MSITEIISLITAISAVIGAIVAALWGREAINAKDASIQAKDTLLDNLKVSQEEVLKAKDVQIDNLRDAQQEVIKAKDTHIQSLDEKIDFLNKFNPDAIRKYYIAVIEQFSAMADVKENRIKELDAEIIGLNSCIADLNQQISQLQVEDVALQRRLIEASSRVTQYEEEHAELTQQTDLLSQELRALRIEKDDILGNALLNEMRLQKIQIRLSEIEFKNDSLEKQLYETSEINRQMSFEVRRVNDLRKSIGRYEKDFERTMEEIAELRHRLFVVERENLELSNRNEVLQKQVDEAQIRRNIEPPKQISASKICARCHLDNDANSQYCSHCGATL